ncbi:YggT family protein [Actinotalea ferrariae]|uniref:YggT family protein n=1 Tax=Actinotalea ferrariae TaxID=1386098 RepID=UPI001C8B2667|nr:YggT family protein [Actinotalea ferrariae]MBX9246523.1 YggT family protein [Actinotalea ferrariae]
MLGIVWDVLYLAVLVYLVLLIVRLVLDWVQVFARDWRPRGVVLVVAEVVYTATDPPIRAVRRVVPPLTLGQVRLDLGFTIVVLACWILLRVLDVLRHSA